MIKTTAPQRQALARLFARGANRFPLVQIGYETGQALLAAGLVTTEGYELDFELTPAGREIGRAEHERAERARKRRNAAARGRHEAALSVGLRRTRYGYE